MASFPEGSEGNQLFPGAKVRIHSVPDDSVKSLYNDQVVVIERYDQIVNRVFVKVDTGESLAFSPANLALAKVEEVAAQPRRASVPGQQENPRGSGGCVLIPGAIVRIHGLRGKDAAEFNAQEAICERWDSESRLMSIRLRNCGTTRAISCKFIRKVILKEQDALGPDAHRVLQIFQDYDLDGDGLIDREEFEKMLNSLGMRQAVLQEFLFTIDKSRDAQVCYEEFLAWALSPVKSNKTRVDLYWPEKKTAAVETVLGSEEDADDHDGELDMTDVERICKGDLPDGWPTHGLAVMNNMHARFPEYPLEGIIFMMARNDFCGGKVLAQIRATGATENDAVRAGAIKIAGAFPANYQNQSAQGHLDVFEDCARGWNFKNMRDSKINAVARLENRSTFKVLEVRRGSEYGFCFGRIEWAGGSRGVQKRGVNYWVVLGLESHGDLAPDQGLRDSSGQVTVGGLHASQLHFSDARRL